MKQSCMWTATGEIRCMTSPPSHGASGFPRPSLASVGPEMFVQQHFQDGPQSQSQPGAKMRTMGGREYFFFDTPAPAPALGCSTNSDCDMSSRCDNLQQQTVVLNGVRQFPKANCVPCSDIGCVAGKSCGTSSDCAEGLSCQAGTCTVGSVQSLVDTGNSYNDQRVAYARLGSASASSGVGDCATTNTCGMGYPCDGDANPSQCGMGLMCSGGVCRSQQGSACEYSSDCGGGFVCQNATCVNASDPSPGPNAQSRGLDYLAGQTSYF